MKIKLNKLLTKNKALFLAYDQGLEHGPTDFNQNNVDPNSIIEIAKKGKFNGIIFQKGLAEKYQKEIRASKVPLILKLNGNTNLSKGEPISPQICSVEEAIKLGASAVGYTIYIGSKHENEMLSEFGKIEEEAHKVGLPVIVWIYPRGKSVKSKSKKELMVRAARTGLEIGADIIKIRLSGTQKDLIWAVKSAGKTRIVIAGGTKQNEKEFLEEVKMIMDSGASGLAIGRNIWQNPKPLEITKKIKKIIFKNDSNKS